MRRIFLSTILLGAALSLPAQQNINLGYDNGEIAESSELSFSGKGWGDAAIELPQRNLGAFDGCKITAVRAGITARTNIDTLRVWVRNSLDGENLATGTIKRSDVKNGWNEIALDNPVTISAGSPLYIGYSYHQRASVATISVVGSENFANSQTRLNGGEWQPSQYSTASIEAVVTGDLLPDYNASLTTVRVMPFKQNGENAVKVSGYVNNFGTESIENLAFSTSLNGSEIAASDTDLVIPSGGMLPFSMVVPTDNAGKGRWVVTASKVNDGDDVYSDDNSTDALYCYQKNIVLEEFTTESCANCPRVAGWLGEVLESGAYNGRAFAITHHAGYGTDWLTQPCDNDYLWFYNENGGSYAPAMMFDRLVITGNAPVLLPSSKMFISSAIDYEIAKSSDVMVAPSLSFNADSTQVTVTVDGEYNDAFKLVTNPRLFVSLTEDNIPAHNQSGAASDYLQQHVNRAYNSTWGDEIVTNADGTFSKSYTFDIDPTWNKQNMHALAFVYNYDENDPNNCYVSNSNQVDFVDNSTATGISTVSPSSSKAAIAEYYNLNGVRIDKPSRGVNIVRLTDGSVRKVLVR